MSPPPGGAGTRSGQVFEAVCVPALRKNGYKVSLQKVVGLSLGDAKHRLDHYVEAPNDDKIIVSVKWQDVSGTTDEKVPFEVIKLLYLMEQYPEFKRAYIVIGGDGHRQHLVDYYVSGGLNRWIVGGDRVTCVTLNQFIKACNRHQL